MTVVRYRPARGRTPWGNWFALQNRFNDMFDEMFGSESAAEEARWGPAVDVTELEDNYEFTIELPGIDKNDVNLEIHENTLRIYGEKKTREDEKGRSLHINERLRGKFSRSFNLPANADPEQIDAEFKDGVLNISLKKKEEAKPKQIEIKVK